jgi:hypothetical protein
MRNDTKTFLATVLGIPMILSGVWGYAAVHARKSEALEPAPAALVETKTPDPVTETAVPIIATTSPAPAAKKPAQIKSAPVQIPTPVPTATPVVAPVATATVTVPVVEPAPASAPEPVVVKKSRRTRAS